MLLKMGWSRICKLTRKQTKFLDHKSILQVFHPCIKQIHRPLIKLNLKENCFGSKRCRRDKELSPKPKQTTPKLKFKIDRLADSFKKLPNLKFHSLCPYWYHQKPHLNWRDQKYKILTLLLYLHLATWYRDKSLCTETKMNINKTDKMTFGMKYKMFKVVYLCKLLLFSKTTNLNRLDLPIMCLNNNWDKQYLSLTQRLHLLHSRTLTKDNLLHLSLTYFNRGFQCNSLNLSNL